MLWRASQFAWTNTAENTRLQFGSVWFGFVQDTPCFHNPWRSADAQLRQVFVLSHVCMAAWGLCSLMNKCILVLGGSCRPSIGALTGMGSLNGHIRFVGDCLISSLGQLQRFQGLDQGGLTVL